MPHSLRPNAPLALKLKLAFGGSYLTDRDGHTHTIEATGNARQSQYQLTVAGTSWTALAPRLPSPIEIENTRGFSAAAVQLAEFATPNYRITSNDPSLPLLHFRTRFHYRRRDLLLDANQTRLAHATWTCGVVHLRIKASAIARWPLFALLVSVSPSTD